MQSDPAIKAALVKACDLAFRQAPPGFGCQAYEGAPHVVATFLDAMAPLWPICANLAVEVRAAAKEART